MLGDAKSEQDLGRHFGWDLYECEVQWVMSHEYARTAEDVIWRRTKLGLRLNEDEIASLNQWMQTQGFENEAKAG